MRRSEEAWQHAAVVERRSRRGSLRYLGSLCVLDDVWKETNARVFHNREKSVGLLFGAIKEEVIIWKEAGVLKGLRE
uniref:Uncharacterized protein n=1 Tax=Oryza sativa subsp. japonica TaxID=39947 RepID=Q69PU8_ORYSJ|nr:hypothetical protein [Oryza sativa Japonica Group]